MSTSESPPSKSLKNGPEVLVLDQVSKRQAKKVILNGLSLRVRAGEVVSIIGGAAAARAVLTRILNGQIGADGGTVLRAGPAGPALGTPMGFNVGGTALRGLEMRAAAYGIDLDAYVGAVADLLRNPEVLRKPMADLDPADRLTILYGSALLLPCTHYTTASGPLPSDKRARSVLRPLLREVRRRAGFICMDKKITERNSFPNQRHLRLHKGQLFPLEDFEEMMKQEKPSKAPQPDQTPPLSETSA